MSQIQNKRLMRKAGLEISEYGLGAWAIGGAHYGPVAEEKAKEVISNYLKSGANFIDTARGYGESERIIGEVITEMGLKHETVIATKTLAGSELSTIPQMRKDLEESLRQLNRDYVDIFFIHFPSEDPQIMDASLSECEKFKKEGLIRAIGSSIKGPDVTQSTVDLATRYIDDGRTDVLLMVYSIFRQMNAPVFELAEKNCVGVILRTVLESGFLTGAMQKGIRFPESDHRCRWNERIDGILDEVEYIRRLAVKEPYEMVSDVALHFAVQGAHHTSVLTGAENMNHLSSNLRAIELPPLPDEVMKALKERYGNMTERFNSGFGEQSFK